MDQKPELKFLQLFRVCEIVSDNLNLEREGEEEEELERERERDCSDTRNELNQIVR